MNVILVGPAALIVSVIGLASCGNAAKPYTASATVSCLRDRAAALSQPSRAAARELRRGPHRERVAYVARSGSTIGLKARGGDYEIDLYRSDEILYFHFARSNREASTLLHDYRSNLDYQLRKGAAERLVYPRRNVVVEWDQTTPTAVERRAVEECLRSKPVGARPPKWRPAPMPKRFAGVFAPAKLPLLELVPRDAVVMHGWSVPAGGGVPPQVAVWWQRTSLAGSSLDTSGFAIWQRLPRAASWRLVSSLRFPLYRVEGVHIRAGDVSGDGHPDLLLFEDMGGSGGCGLYRLLASVQGQMTQLSVRPGCLDNARVRLHGGELVMYDGIVKDPRTLEQIHCCWRVWLRTAMRWRGRKLVDVEKRQISPLPLARLRSRY